MGETVKNPASALNAGELSDTQLAQRLNGLPIICEECGNDEVCEGYHLCSECLEANDQ